MPCGGCCGGELVRPLRQESHLGVLVESLRLSSPGYPGAGAEAFIPGKVQPPSRSRRSCCWWVARTVAWLLCSVPAPPSAQPRRRGREPWDSGSRVWTQPFAPGPPPSKPSPVQDLQALS